MCRDQRLSRRFVSEDHHRTFPRVRDGGEVVADLVQASKESRESSEVSTNQVLLGLTEGLLPIYTDFWCP